MDAPPSHLDGARVLRYVISRRGGFRESRGEAVFALAICRYDGSKDVYLFDCASDWEVIGDAPWDSVDEAMQIALQHAMGETLAWTIVPSD